MTLQFSLFGGEEMIQSYRAEEQVAREALLRLEKEREEREYARRNPSLMDFCEVDKILHSEDCFSPHTCNRTEYGKMSDRRLVPEDRVKILRGFVVLHLWDVLGGTQEKIEMWLKSPCEWFQNETPEVFSFHCWHCMTRWMKNMVKSLELTKRERKRNYHGLA